ncbi:hypothetical protein HMI56_005898, partial [Coelomomyces lativittatus]
MQTKEYTLFKKTTPLPYHVLQFSCPKEIRMDQCHPATLTRGEALPKNFNLDSITKKNNTSATTNTTTEMSSDVNTSSHLKTEDM